MDIRTAILKAADSIEQHPELFDFHSTSIPDCGTPCCALGWIAFHLGDESKILRVGDNATWRSDSLLPVSDPRFYKKMRDINENWRDDANDCAKALRLYADKFHPETDHIPESVRAIFESGERSHV